MSEFAHPRQFTIGDFVRLERHSNVRHEFVHGQIYAMGGGTREHGAIGANVIAQLSMQLRGKPCQVHTSDVRIRVKATGIDTYADVSVVCRRAEYDEEDRLAITNPTVIVEVLSPPTEAYDRGDKLEHYKQIPSLQEVVLIATKGRPIEVIRRVEGDRWAVHVAGDEGAAHLASIGCTLSVADIFRDPLGDFDAQP